MYYLSVTMTYGLGTIIIPIFQMKKAEPQRGHVICPSHTSKFAK